MPAPGSTPPSTPPPTQVHRTVNVPREAVGFVIGRHGETVRDMCARSSASIAVDERHKDPRAPHAVFNVDGTREQVDAACALLQEKVNAVLHGRRGHASRDTGLVLSPTTPPPADIAQADETTARASSSADTASSASTPQPAAPQPRPLEMWIPQSKVGMVIGHYGQTISNMQNRSGATIVVHNERQLDNGAKLLTISGQPGNRKMAFDMVTSILDRDGHRGQHRGHVARGYDGAGPSRRERPPETFVPETGTRVQPPPPLRETAPEFPPPGGPGPPGQPPVFGGPPYGTRVPYNHMMFPVAPQRGGGFFQPHMQAVKAVHVPTTCVGIVIGKGGETIRDLQQRSGAYIKVTPDREASEDDQERLIYISGAPSSIELAHNLLNDIVNEGLNRVYRDGAAPFDDDEPFEGTTEREPPRAGPSSAGPLSAGPGAGDGGQFNPDGTMAIPPPMTIYPSNSISLLMQVPNAKVGVIIGKRGQTIRDLQQRSGARIVISKKMDTSQPHNPRDVKITGPTNFAERARALILEQIHAGSGGGGGDRGRGSGRRSPGGSSRSSPVARGVASPGIPPPAGLPPPAGQFPPSHGYPAGFPHAPFLAVPPVEGFPEPVMDTMRGRFAPPAAGYTQTMHVMQTQTLHQQAFAQQAQAMQQQGHAPPIGLTLPAFGPPPYQMFSPASPAFQAALASPAYQRYAPPPAEEPERALIPASVLAYPQQADELAGLTTDTAALRLSTPPPATAPEGAAGAGAGSAESPASGGQAGGDAAEAHSPSNGAGGDVEASSGE